MKRIPLLRMVSVSLFVCAWLLAGSQAVYAEDCGVVGWFVGCAYVNHDENVKKVDLQIETVKADAQTTQSGQNARALEIQAQQAAQGLADAAREKALGDARVAEAEANGTINKAMYDAQAIKDQAYYDAKGISDQANAQIEVQRLKSSGQVDLEKVKTGAASTESFMFYLLIAGLGFGLYQGYKTHTRAKVELAKVSASVAPRDAAIDRYAGLVPWQRQAAMRADDYNYYWEVKSKESILISDGTTTKVFNQRGRLLEEKK